MHCTVLTLNLAFLLKLCYSYSIKNYIYSLLYSLLKFLHVKFTGKFKIYVLENV